MPFNVVENRQLLYIISMFLIVQFTGLILATQVFSGASFIPAMTTVSQGGTAGNFAYLGYIIIAIAAFSIILVLLFRFVKTDVLFLLLEIWVVGAASLIFFLAVLGSLSGNAFSILFGNGPSLPVLAIALLCSTVLVATKLKWHRLRNVTAMVASVGAGLALGVSFSFWFALAFMVLLAVYDFIAVFITKHMVSLANAAMSKNLSLMIMASEVEAVPVSYLNKKEQSEYSKAKKDLASRGPMFRSVMEQGMVPLSARTALGTGDLMAPLMLAISAYTVSLNFTLSIVIVIGAVLGLALTMYVLKKYKRPLPAIPFLLSGILVALGIFFLASLL